MRAFITKILLFTAVLLGFIALMFGLNRIILSSSLGPFKLRNDQNILVLGNSQMAGSFDERYLSHFKNLAHGGDPFFYSYIKLRKAHEINSQIDTLYIGFNSSNISSNVDQKWFLNENQLNEKLKLYLPITPGEEYKYLWDVKPKTLIRSSCAQSLVLAQVLFAGKMTYGGSVPKSEKLNPKRFQKYRQESVEYDSLEISKHEIHFLNKIISYCKRNQIQVILINPPVHQIMNERTEGLQRDFYSYYFANYPEIPFYDYGKLEMKDEYFKDLVHMSAEGAKYFSEKLASGELCQIGQELKPKD